VVDTSNARGLRSIAVGIACATVFWLILATVSVLLPRAPIHDALAAAFASGALTSEDEAVGDARRGASQFNDCIIWGATLLRPGTALEDLASPVRPNSRGVERDERACGTLRSAVESADAASQVTFERYHRYLFGQRGIAASALQVMSVDSLRILLSVATHGAALALMVAGGLLLSSDRRRGLALVGAGAALLVFFGLLYFGQSIAHAPGDIVAMLLLLWMFSRDPHDTARRASTLGMLAFFGGLTAIFELMIGTLPAGAAAVVLGYAWDASRRARSPLAAWQEAAMGLGAYAGGFLAMFVVKLVITVAIYDTGVLADFSENLFKRAGLTTYEDAASSRIELTLVALNGLRGSITTLFYGYTWLAYAGVGLAALLAAIALVRARAADAVLYVLAMLAIPVWFVLFPEHTARHGWLMARIVIWPILCAYVFFVSTLRTAPSPSPGRVASAA
jgi:hypothetical protein